MQTEFANDLARPPASAADPKRTGTLRSFLMVCDVVPRQYGGGQRFWVELGRKARAQGIRMGLLLAGEPIPHLAADFRKHATAWWSLPDWKRENDTEQRWKFIKGFRRVNSLEPWDVVSFHHCNPISVTYACAWSRIRDGRRFARVWHQHTGIPAPRGLKKYVSTLRLLGSSMDAFVVNSELGVQSFQERHCFSDKVKIIHNGVVVPESPCRGLLRARLGLPESVSLLATVASLIHRKGLDVLLEAVAPLFKKEGGDWHLVIVGDGPLRSQLEELTRGLQIESRVHFFGRSNNVLEILPDCDAFVLPSRNEAMPVAVLEAMATALPVVATAVGCVGDVVVPGKTGLLVPPDDVGALRSALRTVLADKDLARTFGARGRERVQQAFSLDQMVAGYLDLYRKVCA